MDFPTSMKKGWSKIDIQFYASVSLGNAQFTHEYALLESWTIIFIMRFIEMDKYILGS